MGEPAATPSALLGTLGSRLETGAQRGPVQDLGVSQASGILFPQSPF